MRILNFLKGEKKMTVEPMYLMAENKVFSGEYRDTETRDTFDMKEEEVIRNEVINVCNIKIYPTIIIALINSVLVKNILLTFSLILSIPSPLI